MGKIKAWPSRDGPVATKNALATSFNSILGCHAAERALLPPLHHHDLLGRAAGCISQKRLVYPALCQVAGGVGKHVLELVGLGHQQADVPVVPLGCRHVLDEEQDALVASGGNKVTACTQCLRLFLGHVKAEAVLFFHAKPKNFLFSVSLCNFFFLVLQKAYAKLLAIAKHLPYKLKHL